MSIRTLCLLCLMGSGVASITVIRTTTTTSTTTTSTTTTGRFAWLLSSSRSDSMAPKALSLEEMASRRQQLLRVARQARLLHLAQMHNEHVESSAKKKRRTSARVAPGFRSRPRRRPTGRTGSTGSRLRDLDRRSWRYMFKHFWHWLQSRRRHRRRQHHHGRHQPRPSGGEKEAKGVEKRSSEELERIRRNRRLLRETLDNLKIISDRN